MTPLGLLSSSAEAWTSAAREAQILGVSIIVMGVIGLALAVAMLAVATKRRRDRSHR